MERIAKLFRSRKKQNDLNSKAKVKTISWRDSGSCIFINVKVEEATPVAWIKRFEINGNRVSVWMKEILLDLNITFQTKCTEYEFVLVKGILFSNKDRTCEYVADYGTKHGYTAPSFYESCLLAEAIDPEMLNTLRLEWIIMMSGTIITKNGKEKLPVVQLNKNIKIGEDKIVFTLYNFRPELKQNSSGLYAFIADPKHGLK